MIRRGACLAGWSQGDLRRDYYCEDTGLHLILMKPLKDLFTRKKTYVDKPQAGESQSLRNVTTVAQLLPSPIHPPLQPAGLISATWPIQTASLIPQCRLQAASSPSVACDALFVLKIRLRDEWLRLSLERESLLWIACLERECVYEKVA